MPHYLRYYLPGGTYFFTLVTYNRLPIFNSPVARDLLDESFRVAIGRYPFTLDAYCLLPEHFHCIWTLPENESNFSIRWSFIKAFFTHRYKDLANISIGPSRERRREGSIWQRRFWEHLIRDEKDLENHLNYIHFNPVKHGLVQEVGDWPYSSFKRYVDMGFYGPEWNDQDSGNRIDFSKIWD